MAKQWNWHIDHQIGLGGDPHVRHSLLATAVPAGSYGYLIYQTERNENGDALAHVVVDAGVRKVGDPIPRRGVQTPDQVEVEEVPADPELVTVERYRDLYEAVQKLQREHNAQKTTRPQIESIEHGLQEALRRIKTVEDSVYILSVLMDEAHRAPGEPDTLTAEGIAPPGGWNVEEFNPIQSERLVPRR